MPRAIVDTGVIVALVNRADQYHPAVVAWFRAFRGELLTTDAVLTEVTYVLSSSLTHQASALTWIERARVARLLRIIAIANYEHIAHIMLRYERQRCDYADATLIALAEQSGVLAIATIDQRDFSVYRVGRKRFRILLPD